MTPLADFTAILEQQVHLTGRPFDRGAVLVARYLYSWRCTVVPPAPSRSMMRCGMEGIAS